MRATFRRHDLVPALVPVDDKGVRYVSRLKPGEGVTVEVKRVRSLAQLRKWWSFMEAVGKAIDRPAEAVSDYALVNTGYVDVHRFGKETWQRPRSLAFGNMKQDEFNAAYDAAVAFILAEICPHLPPEAAASIERFAI